MVDRAETIWKQKKGLYHRAEFGEVQVSQNDTVTLDNFKSSVALLKALFVKKADGTEMANTIALNACTITGAGTNVDCIYIAYGYKA
jgi:hypothetical protein